MSWLIRSVNFQSCIFQSLKFQSEVYRKRHYSREMENVYLHHIEANLISKQHSNLYQNRSSFVKDITNKYFGLFFPDTLLSNIVIFRSCFLAPTPPPASKRYKRKWIIGHTRWRCQRLRICAHSASISGS